MEKCRRMKRQTVYVKNWIYSWLSKSSKTRQQYCRLGKVRDENGYSDEWIHGQKPHLIKNGIRIPCNTENFVPIVVPGLSSSSSGSSSTSKTPSRQESHSSSYSSPPLSSPAVCEIRLENGGDRIESDISPVHVSTTVDERSGRPDETQANKNPKPNKKESKEQSDSLCSDIPEWLQEFTEILVDEEIPVHGDYHASSSHEASLGPIFKRREDLGKHSVYTHFPKDRHCEICKRTKITRAPCRRRNGEAVPRAEKIGDLITADHKGLSDNCGVSKQSSICCRGAGPSHSMDPGVSVQKQKLHKKTREACKSYWNPRGKPKVILHWQFLGIRQGLWRSLLESLHVYTTQIRNKWDCWKSSAQSKERHLCCIVAIRSGWKLVGIFHGMLHLSAKRHRSIVWWKNSIRQTFWRTI